MAMQRHLAQSNTIERYMDWFNGIFKDGTTWDPESIKLYKISKGWFHKTLGYNFAETNKEEVPAGTPEATQQL